MAAKSKARLYFSKFLEAWKRVGRRIGDAQARILLTLFYLLIVGPFALMVRWGADPLGIKSSRPRGWIPRTDSDKSPMKRALEQF